MQQTTTTAQPERVRRGTRGPAPIEKPRDALVLWAYPKFSELSLLEEAGESLVREGAHEASGMKLRNGHLSPSNLAMLLVRFHRENPGSLVSAAPESGGGDKKMRIALNADEAAEWSDAADAVRALLDRGVACSPRLVLLTLASYYLEHRNSRQVCP